MELVRGLRQHGVTSVRLGDFEAQISPMRPVERAVEKDSDVETARRLELFEAVS